MRAESSSSLARETLPGMPMEEIVGSRLGHRGEQLVQMCAVAHHARGDVDRHGVAHGA